MPAELKYYAPFEKIDADQRIVSGIATSEALDGTGEIVDFEATKAAVAEWLKWRNIREMHKASAVGVAEKVELDDTQRAMRLSARIVDDEAWKKVKTGVYKGFSIGGRILASVLEKANGENVRRITKYMLTEVSLVDRPANPQAVFTLVKRDGETNGDTSSEDGEQEDAPEAMTAEAVRAIVLDLLTELGLVTSEGGEVSLVSHTDDLRKALENREDADRALEKALQEGRKRTEALVGDLAKTVSALEELEKRLDAMEARKAEFGPVLRELGTPNLQTVQEIEVLKRMMETADDPLTRQAFGARIAELQIKSAHEQGA